MHSKKHLSFGSLIEGFSKILLQVEDKREKGKIDYSMRDTMMSGLACMVFQAPSFLEFQRQLEEINHKNNLQTLFGVKEIPSDNCIREIIDEIDSEKYKEVFTEYFKRLQRGKHLKKYEFLNGYYLCPIDGTEYFSSSKINCNHCLVTEHRNGEKTYSHKVVQAAIVNPNIKQVIPMMPEEIKNIDGTDKQDCEINASKRLIKKIRKDHPQLNLIIVGDGLYSKQPFIEEVNKIKMHYILVAKEEDHKYLKEWLIGNDEFERLEILDKEGKNHVYEWINDVPLNGREDGILVNYIRYKIVVQDKDGKEKINYKNTWVTDIKIDKKNAIKIAKGGRTRWKIENECFNTLKNQGYHIDHNFGHGKTNLCFNFFVLILLAFFIHQIEELTDIIFQQCRIKFGSKRYLWEKIRSAIEYMVFDNWEHLLDYMLNRNNYKTICTKI